MFTYYSQNYAGIIGAGLLFIVTLLALQKLPHMIYKYVLIVIVILSLLGLNDHSNTWADIYSFCHYSVDEIGDQIFVCFFWTSLLKFTRFHLPVFIKIVYAHYNSNM